MTDYSKQGLDANLRPINSPAVENTKDRVTGYEFNSDNERNAIGATNIQNFSFSTGRGGTLTLGGTANGDGLMVLKNATGGTIFTGNNTGHHYYGTSGVEQVRVDNIGFHAYQPDGTTEQLRISVNGVTAYGTTPNVLQFISSSSGTVSYGAIGFSTGLDAFYIASGNGKNAYYFTDTGKNAVYAADGTVLLNGGNYVAIRNDSSNQYNFYDPGGGGGYWTLTMNANKTAIVPTKEGYKALYTNESPEVWFTDFCKIKRTWKFWKQEYEIDPMFLEVTVGPYHFIPTFDRNIAQVWGKRKGSEHLRFTSKSKQEFIDNNKFWSTYGKVK